MPLLYPQLGHGHSEKNCDTSDLLAHCMTFFSLRNCTPLLIHYLPAVSIMKGNIYMVKMLH
jgi:hypothetical protein